MNENLPEAKAILLMKQGGDVVAEKERDEIAVTEVS